MRPCEIVKLVEYIKEQTGHTGDIFININDNAIPIEWILKWACEFIDPNSEGYKMAMELVHDWRKENEENILKLKADIMADNYSPGIDTDL